MAGRRVLLKEALRKAVAAFRTVAGHLGAVVEMNVLGPRLPDRLHSCLTDVRTDFGIGRAQAPPEVGPIILAVLLRLIPLIASNPVPRIRGLREEGIGEDTAGVDVNPLRDAMILAMAEERGGAPHLFRFRFDAYSFAIVPDHEIDPDVRQFGGQLLGIRVGVRLQAARCASTADNESCRLPVACHCDDVVLHWSGGVSGC